MATHHEIPATPENMILGYLDAANPPVLEVDSGDTVKLYSFPAGGMECLPERSRVPADYMAALTALPSGPGPHFITGPVYVRGAQPGDTLLRARRRRRQSDASTAVGDLQRGMDAHLEACEIGGGQQSTMRAHVGDNALGDGTGIEILDAMSSNRPQRLGEVRIADGVADALGRPVGAQV